MARPALHPLDYVSVQTKLPLHMHRTFTTLAARLGIARMTLYMYAIRFAFQSGKEFETFVRTIQKGKVKNVTKR